RIERSAAAREIVIQCLGLRNGPREAVQEEAGHAVGLVQPLANKFNHDRPGNELAGIEVLLGLFPGGSALVDRLAEHFSGRNMRDAKLLDQSLRLRSLSSARRSEED